MDDDLPFWLFKKKVSWKKKKKKKDTGEQSVSHGSRCVD
jgi:hypothetical protein